LISVACANGAVAEYSYVRVGGARMRVAVRGEGPPLLLITGLGANIEMWEPFDRLVEGRTTIRFDAPGMGESETLARPVRMGGLARLVGDLMDELGFERADVLGYSLGGGVAQELARRRPQLVRRLVLCGTGPGLGGFPPRNPLVIPILATPYRYYDAAFYARVAPLLMGGRTGRNRDVLRAHLELRMRRPPTWTGYAHQVYAACGWTSIPWLHTLKMPTLVVAGDDDPIMPVASSRMLAWLIPDARLHVVHGGGHLFLVDQPETVLPAIDEFLGAPAAA
jgi:poly(3-hydroxyoctanoate) depolymerase